MVERAIKGLLSLTEFEPHPVCVSDVCPGPRLQVLDGFDPIARDVDLLQKHETEPGQLLSHLRISGDLLIAHLEQALDHPPGMKSGVVANQDSLSFGGMSQELGYQAARIRPLLVIGG